MLKNQPADDRRDVRAFQQTGGVLSESANATTLLFLSTLHHPLCKWRHNAIFTYESTAKQIAYAVCLLHKHSVNNYCGSWTHLLFLNVQLLTREH